MEKLISEREAKIVVGLIDSGYTTSDTIEELKEEIHKLKLKTDEAYAEKCWNEFIEKEYDKYVMTDEWFEAYRLHTINKVNAIFSPFSISTYTDKEAIVNHIYKLQEKDLDSIRVKDFNYKGLVIDIGAIPSGMELAEMMDLYHKTGYMLIDSNKVNTKHGYVPIKRL